MNDAENLHRITVDELPLTRVSLAENFAAAEKAYREKINDLHVHLRQATRQNNDFRQQLTDLLQRNDRLAAAGHRLVLAVREHNTNPNHGPGTGHTDNLAAQLLAVIGADRKPWTRETWAHEQDYCGHCIGRCEGQHEPCDIDGKCKIDTKDEPAAAGASVPRVARVEGDDEVVIPLADIRAARGVLSPEWLVDLASGGVIPVPTRLLRLRQVVSPSTPLPMPVDAFDPLLVLAEIAAERAAQDEQWGEQNHPDGTEFLSYWTDAQVAREASQKADAGGMLTWGHVLREVYEALAEAAPADVRHKLVQVAAVAVAWIEAIDRRTAAEASR
ncbi:hypothetical protein ACQPZJ_01630 [Actinoplanes sp. CA-054009]